MTNESLQKLINMYNKNSWKLPIHEFEIGPGVVHARIPDQFDYPNYRTASNYFIIKNGKTCVGIIQNGGKNDLHWYNDSKHRGKGYMCNALQKTVLPYLIHHLEREYQNVTVRKGDTEAKRYALNRGFLDNGKEEGNSKILELDKSKVKPFNAKHINRKKLSSQRETKIKFELEKIILDLRLIDDEIYCAFGDKLPLTDVIQRLNIVANEIQLFNNISSPPNP